MVDFAHATEQDGIVVYELKGKTPQEALLREIQEMRLELRRIENVLGSIELRARSWGAFSSDTDGQGSLGIQTALKPQFALLFNWYLSAMESFIAMSWLVYGKGKTREVVVDFMRRFQGWNKI